MDMIEIEGGEVTASLDDRTITGLLIPYGEDGRTNVGTFSVDAGVIRIPADPTVVGLNLDHDRYAPVGRAARVWETPQGIMASLAVATTPEGDAALADARNPQGKRRRLSGEFRTNIKAGKATGGVLAGAALVEMGAFPSAMVLAADTPDESEPAPEEQSDSKYVTRFTDAEGVEWERVSESTTKTTVTKISDAPAADEDPEEEEKPEVTQTVQAGAVPATIAGGSPAATTEPVSKTAEVLAALSSLKFNPHDAEALGVLAAIADVKFSGAGALPGSGVLRENWLGQLYQGVQYERQFIGLGTHGTDVSAAGKRGFRIFRGTAANPLAPQDGSWIGNKTPINGYAGASDTLGSLLYKFAVGNDIDRQFYDLPGGVEVVEAFLKLVIEDYLYWSDRIAREAWVAAAGNPIAPKAYPAIYNTNGTGALGQLIQGILAVKRRKADQRQDVPTFAIVNDIAFEQLAYAAGGEQNLPAFVNLALSTDRSGTVDGSVTIVNGDTGTSASPSVIVGAGRAIDFDELQQGTPLVIDAIDLAKGGIDKASHGYLQTFTQRPEAVVHIATPDAWAATTPEPVGAIVKLGTGQTLQAILPAAQVPGAAFVGVTGGAAPAAPAAVGQTVTDGTVNWKRIA